jgi:hypothetical protein
VLTGNNRRPLQIDRQRGFLCVRIRLRAARVGDELLVVDENLHRPDPATAARQFHAQLVRAIPITERLNIGIEVHMIEGAHGPQRFLVEAENLGQKSRLVVAILELVEFNRLDSWCACAALLRDHIVHQRHAAGRPIKPARGIDDRPIALVESI